MFVTCPEEVEFRATTLGLNLTQGCRCRSVVVESDRAKMMRKLEGGRLDCSVLGMFTAEFGRWRRDAIVLSCWWWEGR